MFFLPENYKFIIYIQNEAGIIIDKRKYCIEHHFFEPASKKAIWCDLLAMGLEGGIVLVSLPIDMPL